MEIPKSPTTHLAGNPQPKDLPQEPQVVRCKGKSDTVDREAVIRFAETIRKAQKNDEELQDCLKHIFNTHGPSVNFVIAAFREVGRIMATDPRPEMGPVMEEAIKLSTDRLLKYDEKCIAMGLTPPETKPINVAMWVVCILAPWAAKYAFDTTVEMQGE